MIQRSNEQSRGAYVPPHGQTFRALLFELNCKSPVANWTQSFGDQLALAGMPEELCRRLQRYCDLNPVGAKEMIEFAVDLYDAGIAKGRDEGWLCATT